MAKKTDEVKDDRPVSREEFNNLEAFVRIMNDKIERHSANFKELVKRIYDDACGGKVGFTRGQHLVSAAVVSILLCIGIAKAADLWVLYKSDATYGTCYVSGTGGAATLTVDAIAGAVTGDVTCDDINMSGSVSDSLGHNITKAASVTGLAATVNFANVTASGGAIATDYVNYKLLTMPNDSAESIDWAYLYVVVDDNTTNTEDSAVELYIQVAGTATKMLDVNASGLAVAGTVDANAVTVDAGAGIDCQAAGALQIGISTATSVDIGGAGEMTTVKGTLNVDQAVTLDTTLAVAGTTTLTNATVNGVITGLGGATIDNTTSASALTITEDTVAIVGAATVSSTLGVSGTTTMTNATINGIITGNGGATIDNATSDTVLTLTEDTVAIVGAATVSSTLGVSGTTTLTNTTVNGVITGLGGGTIDNTTSATAMTLTEDTVAIVGAATVSSTLDVNGATTCTNIMVDPGATVTLNTNTINAIGSTVTISGSVLTGGGTAILTNSLVENCAIGGTVAAAGAFTTLSGSTSVKDNGYQTVLASSANDGGAALKLYMFTTNVTMHAGTVWTQALDFTSAILGVQATSTEAEAEPPCITSIATNEVQVTVTADKNFSLMVLGTY